MTALEYARKKYPLAPNFQKIAIEAYKQGMRCSTPKHILMYEMKYRDTKKELDSLWDTLHDPQELSKLLTGL